MTEKQQEFLNDASAGDGKEGECVRCGEKTLLVKYGMCDICADDMGA